MNGLNVSIEDKNKLRERFLEALRNQNEQDRLIKSRLIQGKLFGRAEFRAAKTILFYASFDGEVETFQMIKQATQLNKRIALPMITKGSKNFIPTLVKEIDSLNEGPYGIKQPVYAHEHAVGVHDLDLVIVPGIAFDKFHNRLGRGAGYYDRFLAALPEDTPSFGLAFDFQLVDRLPHLEAHDMSLTDVIVN
jgi:5-formyltetrahydrofolate cyclo-ligase